MANININGKQLELDLLDADVMEKYETLNQEIVEKIQEPEQYKGLTNAQGMRLQCKYIDEFFDKLFGNGTAGELFTTSGNLGARLDAFAAVAQASTQAKNDIDGISNKYGVGRLNREQRRADIKQFKKHKGH